MRDLVRLKKLYRNTSQDEKKILDFSCLVIIIAQNFCTEKRTRFHLAKDSDYRLASID